MKQMHVLETFEDIEMAFRSDKTEKHLLELGHCSSPRAGLKDSLSITESGRLLLYSDTMLLTKDLEVQGYQFVKFCIQKVIGSRGQIDKWE